MTNSQNQFSILPPKKYRDPSFAGQTKEQLKQTHKEYIEETLKASVRESLKQGKIVPKLIAISENGQKQLDQLQAILCISKKELLNMALAYGYHETKRENISIEQLRSQIETLSFNQNLVTFEINEQVLDILFQSGVTDAQFIYLNIGINLLYDRLLNFT